MNSHTHSFADVQDRTVEWLEEEAQIVLNRYYFILSQRNAAVPACTIPAEIVLRILTLVQAGTSGTNLWILSTLVCRYWRDVALSSQRLWSLIVPTSSECVDVVAQRSGQMPLRMRWHHDNRRGSAWRSVQAITQYIDRLIEVDVTIDGRMETWNPVLHAANLKSLSLVYTSNTLDNYQRIPNIPENLAATLHTLCLSAIKPNDWRCLAKCTSLRHLEISRIHKDARPSIDEFLDVLEQLSSLEHLKLYRSSPYRGAATPLKLLPLQRLRSLYVASDKCKSIAGLLGHLVLPSTTALDLHALSNTASKRHVLNCFPRDRSCFPTIRALSRMELKWSLGNILLKGFIPEVQDGPHFSLSIAENDPQKAIPSSVLGLGKLLEQTSLQELTLYFQLAHLTFMNADRWHRALAPLHSLRTLRFEDHSDLENPRQKLSEPLIGLLQALKRTDDTTSDHSSVPQLMLLSLKWLKDSVLQEIDGVMTSCLQSRRASKTKNVSSFQIIMNDTPVVFIPLG